MLNLLDDFAHFIEIFVMIFMFYMGFKLGASTVKEIHYYHYENEVEIPTDEEGNPAYNKSVPDPEYAAWYNKK